ncbi:unnamed protein product [Wuchereria bancrofti]|uniref:Uncharacterized protein n=1 Tax=Wuchereria bancrofti TaxID=6293 RepID=A0A3P7DIX2_WUCBA|nr:unnamed protein product [Wuchereria bancrofti]
MTQAPTFFDTLRGHHEQAFRLCAGLDSRADRRQPTPGAEGGRIRSWAPLLRGADFRACACPGASRVPAHAQQDGTGRPPGSAEARPPGAQRGGHSPDGGVSPGRGDQRHAPGRWRGRSGLSRWPTVPDPARRLRPV